MGVLACECLCAFISCSPMTLNRHNEVWYVVEGDPVCSGKQTDASPVP